MLVSELTPVIHRANQGYKRVRKGVGNTTVVTSSSVTTPTTSSCRSKPVLYSSSTDEWCWVDCGIHVSATVGVVDRVYIAFRV